LFIGVDDLRLLQDIKRLEEALAIAFAHVDVRGREGKRAIEEGLGCVSSRGLFAGSPLPHFARSTMDGYCLRAADTNGASESIPAMLARGVEIHPVLTGGPIAAGTDAVVMLEYTEELEDGTVLVSRPVAVGENILAVGEDVPQGTELVRAGEILTARKLALLAAFGYDEIPVRDFRVLILSSGNEIVPVSEQPSLGQVRDINAYYLHAMCCRMGLSAVCGGIVPDDATQLYEALLGGITQYDAVLLSGGSSAGSLDYSRSVIDRLGTPGVLVHGLMIKPGKPTIVGSCHGKLVLGLPGHPLSCALTAHTVARPLLSHAAGLVKREPLMIEGRLVRPIASAPGRRDHIPVLVERGNVFPLLSKSASISALARSNGLLTIDEGCEGLSEGAAVSVEFWEE
jgi:molybdopterin molybdotransferase